MKNILLLTSFLVCAYALPAYEEPIDSNNDPQNYKNIEILLLESAVDQDGGYSFSFENDDGSKVTQEGQHKIIDDDHTVERIRGAYSYNDVNGQPVGLTYTADENGFRPVGAHLPTSPPIPLEILRSLKYLATAKPFVDEELYDYKPKKKVFRGRQYTLNAVQLSRSSLRSNVSPVPLAAENAVQRSRNNLRSNVSPVPLAAENSGQLSRSSLRSNVSPVPLAVENAGQRSRNNLRSNVYPVPLAAENAGQRSRNNLRSNVSPVALAAENDGQLSRNNVRSNVSPVPLAVENAGQRSRNNLRSNIVPVPLDDETPSHALLKSVEDEPTTKPESTSETIPEVTSEETVETSPESVRTTADQTADDDEKPAVESTLSVVNESKKKIQDALKESLEKTSQLAQSATKETASAAIAGIRGEVQKLNDNVKLHVTNIRDKISGAKTEAEEVVSESAKQSRDVIEKYTGIVGSAVDEALVDIAPTDEA